jgi:predicted PurR-regulated permease PerM
MKFHYWKSLILMFFVCALILVFFAVSPIDPLTLARAKNKEVIIYLQETKMYLENGKSIMEQKEPYWLQNARQTVNGATVVMEDQSEILKQIADKSFGPYIQSLGPFLATIVAIFGTLSTIILSWRKDMREARREINQLKSEPPKIELN